MLTASWKMQRSLALGRFRKCKTNGQSGRAPEAKDQPQAECGTSVRRVQGELIFLAGGTRGDLSHPISRLGSFLDRWCDWSLRELKHILGYLLHTVDYRLEFEGGKDAWEDLILETQCDAAFGVTSHGGHKLRLK